ncbi:MAG: hypothetical protein AABY84_12660 [Candidatus Firestonebacteria bacterium]
MKIVKQSKDGIDYLVGLLKDKAKTITRVILWRIPHNSQQDDIYNTSLNSDHWLRYKIGV